MGATSGTETQPITSFTSAAALRLVPIGQFKTGDFASIQAAPGAFPHVYQLVADSVAVDDGMHVINDSGSQAGTLPGRWLLTNIGPVGPVSGEHTDQFVVAHLGDTTFALSAVPLDPNNLQFYVNGLLQVQIVNYTIAGNIVTWLNVNYTLSAGWLLTAIYT